MRMTLLLVGAAAIAGCAPTAPVQRTAEARAHLDQLLVGRVAGPPQSCIHQLRTRDMVTIDDDTVVFKVGSTYYRNDFRGEGCPSLSRGGSAMVTKSTGGERLCSGEIITIQDTASGMMLGGCSFGEFVPYRKV
jgi:hypothetical protein